MSNHDPIFHTRQFHTRNFTPASSHPTISHPYNFTPATSHPIQLHTRYNFTPNTTSHPDNFTPETTSHPIQLHTRTTSHPIQLLVQLASNCQNCHFETKLSKMANFWTQNDLFLPKTCSFEVQIRLFFVNCWQNCQAYGLQNSQK